MAIRLIVASLVLAPVAVIAIAACGGSGGASIFPNSQDDSGAAAPPYEGGSLIPNLDANADATFACTPAALGTYKAVWKKPATPTTNECNAQQLEDFYDKCLLEPLTSTDCTTFIAANGDCSTCLQSDDTDSTYGPVIWHSNHAYYTLNTAGCIAIQQGDSSATSCGAAYQEIVQCEETACNACGAADYSEFPQCESNAGSGECSDYATTEGTTCGAELKDASDPGAVCKSAPDTADAYQIIAPIFCGGGGPSGNNDDGGTD